MVHEFRCRRRVEFAETDMAGIAHFAHFFRWMEATEHELFRSLGLLLHENNEDGMFGMVRRHAACDYRSPLRYQDEFEIQLLVRRKGKRSLTYDFQFRRVPEGASEALAEPVAQGRLVVVSVRRQAGEEQVQSVPLSAAIQAALEAAPAALLPPLQSSDREAHQNGE